MASIIEQIQAIVGDNGIITGEDVGKRAGDWLGRTKCGAFAVVRPANTQELSEVMKICYAAGQKVVAAGGLTGLVHGADAVQDELMISFERMNKVLEVDKIGRTMLVEAGTPLQKAHEAAKEHDLMFAVDLGARGSCTVGGNISTNAGGNQVIRYGMMREQILGLEAVLADGTIISSLNTLLKNNSGYDLKQLFIGSEGTLGLVTRAVLRLHALPKSTNVAFVGFDDFGSLVNFFGAASRAFGGALTSFEVMWDSYYELIVGDGSKHNPPLAKGRKYYAIVECQGYEPEKDADNFNAILEKMVEDEMFVDAMICQSLAQAQAVWAIREDIVGLFMGTQPAAVFDVSLPIATMEKYLHELYIQTESKWGAKARVVVFGHLGDCNLHIVVSPGIWEPQTQSEIEEIVYPPLKALGGAVSAEHGIGLEKRNYLHHSRGETEIALMRTLKNALDPKQILNSGKVLN
jgi:FAD/FMN-containing dehydrogenase